MKRYPQLLLLATAAWAANYTRTTLGPLQETMQRALSLSDNQVALLQGLALALPLALGAIPIGLLADRVSRKAILLSALTLALFSTMLTAFSGNFGVLLIARFLTGLSLPGGYICAYAMAGDLFEPELRGRATTIVAIGEIGGPPAAFALGGMLLVKVASVSGLRFGGWNLADWGWSLLWMGGVLLPVLLLLLMLLHEPARRDVRAERLPMRGVWLELWKWRAVAVPLQLARATLFMADGAVYVWGAPLFSRKFHLSPDRIGAMLGLSLLIGGLLGPAFGGPLVDFFQTRGGPRRIMWILGAIAFLTAPLGLFPLLPEASWAAAILSLFLILGYTIAAAAMALTLIVIPGELRGLNVGISLLVGSIFFVGLAPLAVSGLSGYLGGEAMLGKALAIVCAFGSLVSAAVLGSTARYFPGSQNG